MRNPIELKSNATLNEARAFAIKSIKAEAQDRIYKVAPLHKQLLRLRGKMSAEDTKAQDDAIDAIREASNKAEEAIMALKTIDEVLNFSW